MTNKMTSPLVAETIIASDTQPIRSLLMPDCPSPEVLEAFLHGTLADADLQTVANHLQHCIICDAMLSDLKVGQPVGQPVEANSNASLALQVERRSVSVGKPDLLNAVTPERLTQQMLGPYELLEKLGQGGMGAVYRARHTKLNRIEAIKILPPHLAKDASAKSRFEREMHAVGALNHPNIVQARHADEADDQLYLVMEFVDGCDLASVIKRHGRLPIADACEIIRQAALGLQHAHEHGLVHRDIKPSNLMLALDSRATQTQSRVTRALPEEGEIGRRGDGERVAASPPPLVSHSPILKILDLGLARLDSATEQLGELTSTGQIMGTLDYMAPEQGGDAHQVDIRADLYSLGATLYHLLTGQPTFPPPKYKTAAQKLQALTFSEPTPIRDLRPEVPESLAALVHRLLAKKPDRRFALPHEVAMAIAPFTLGHNLAQLVVTGGAVVKAPELASTFQHSSSSLARTDAEVRQPFQLDRSHATGVAHAGPTWTPPAPIEAAARNARPSTAHSGQGKKPSRRWLAFAGAAAFLLFGVWIIIKDKDGQELARFKVPSKATIEIQPESLTSKLPPDVNSDTPTPGSVTQPQSSPQEKVAASPTTPQTVIKVGVPVERPHVEPLQLAPMDVTIAPGAPLCRHTLVPRPQPIPGVLSWTIETKHNRGTASQLAVSPDRSTFAAAGEDGIVRIWNVREKSLVGMLISDIKTNTGGICSLSWSPNGDYLAVAASNDGVTIWRVHPAQVVAKFEGDPDVVSWSPTGNNLAYSTPSRSGEIVVWDLSNHTKRNLPWPGGSHTRSLKWSRDGKWLAVGNYNTPIEVFDTRTGSHLFSLGDATSTGDLDWSPDGRRIAYRSSSKIVKVWDIEEQNQVAEYPSTSFTRGSVEWSPTGESLLIDSHAVVQSATGVVVKLPSNTASASASSQQQWINDDKLVSSHTWGVVSVFTLSAKRWTHFALSTPPYSALLWSRSGVSVATMFGSLQNQPLTIFDLSDPKVIPSLRVGHGPISCSPDGERIATLGDGIEVTERNSARKKINLKLPKATTLATAWMEDGQHIVSLDSDEKLRVWDVATGDRDPVVEIGEKLGSYCRLAFSPDFKWLAMGHGSERERRLVLWDTSNWTRYGPGWPCRVARELAWSRDSSRIAYGEQVLTLKTQRLLETNGHILAWLPDGVDVRTKLNRVFLTDGMSELPVKHEHDWHAPTAVTVAPNAKMFATGDSHGVVWVWDATTREPLGSFHCFSPNRCMAISPDGHYRSNSPIEESIVYVVQTADGQQTLTPAEFSQKYGWRNDPSKVKLLAP